MRRAFKKLTDLKNAATMALSLLHNIDKEECYGNIFSENFYKNHCSNCRNGIRNLLSMPNLKKFLQKHYVGPMCSTKVIDATAEENLIKNDAEMMRNQQETKISQNRIKKKQIKSKFLL
jgi:hypothetical protein